VGSTQYYLAQTLDGYIAEPDGGLDWLYHFEGESEVGSSESARADVDRFLADVGALAMGSATYEVLLAHGSAWPYGERPSWVFTSRELPTPEDADVRFASGPVRPVHEELLAAAGERNVWILGGGDLATQFAEAKLLDELHLTIIPVVLGEGIPTFVRRLNGRLRLTDIRPFQGGVVQLRYELLG
jgi:dihydrofolate reductase